jgi:hypothetical protein
LVTVSNLTPGRNVLLLPSFIFSHPPSCYSSRSLLNPDLPLHSYMEYTKDNYIDVMPGYLGNPALAHRNLYHSESDDGLESIILKPHPERELDMLGKLFSDRKKNLKATVKTLFGEIELRERLNSFLLYRIDAEICRQHSYLDQLQVMTGHNYSLELFKDLTRTRMQVENNARDLEKEKRKEYLESWRDLSFLKKYLLSALKDYWDLSKRSEALLYGSGESEEDENS